MTDPVPLTYRELAERLGLSPDSARIKAKRRKWQTVPGNHPSDPVRVLVPVEFLNGERSPERSPRVRTGLAPTDSTNEIKALSDALNAVREVMARQRTDHHAEMERLDREVDRARAEVDRIRADVDRLNAELERERQHGRDLTAKLEDAHREALDYARLPWWRRLIGR
jgi:predicted transcriptional regulator